MSKRNSLGNTSGGNTLFKYFTKSPAASPQTPQTPQQRNTARDTNTSATPTSSFTKDKSIHSKVRSNNGKSAKKATNQCDDDDDSTIRSVKPKRLKLIDTDSESDEDRENESGNIKPVDPVPSKKASRPRSCEPSTSQPKKKMKMELNDTAGTSFEDKLKAIKPEDIQDVEEVHEEPVVVWTHNKLEFLKPENIKDIKGNKPDHPDYDPNTLFVPKTFLDGLSPVKYT